jgi:hypothetical protein
MVSAIAISTVAALLIWVILLALDPLTSRAISERTGVALPDQNTTTSFLAVMAQVTGIFLALYFTAVSVVASTVYADVSSRVRQLLIGEKVSTVYIKAISFALALSILMLASSSVGYSIGILDLTVMVLLAMLVVFGFMVLGLRLFYFFDRTRLAGTLTSDLRKYVKHVTPAGSQWRLPGFQAYCQAKAENALLTYVDLAELAANEKNAEPRALGQLAAQMLSMLQEYGREKASIPTDSLWFKRAPRHRSWLESSYEDVSLALHTGTSLPAEPSPDFGWFERPLVAAVSRALGALIEQGFLAHAVELLDWVQRAEFRLAYHSATDEAMRLWEVLEPVVSKALEPAGKAEDTKGSEREHWQDLRMSMFDMCCVALMNVLIGFGEPLRQQKNASSPVTHARQIDWSKRESMYEAALPRRVVQQAEWMYGRLEFERMVEGTMVTARWYRDQIVCRELLQVIGETAQRLIAAAEEAFGTKIEQFLKGKNYFLAAHATERGLEMCSKLSTNLQVMEQACANLREARRIQDMPWPREDWAAAQTRVEALRERIVQNIAELSFPLSAIERSEDLPDYFGHCYAVLAEESSASMCAGNELLFQKVFPPLFLAALRATEQEREKVGEAPSLPSLVRAADPLRDLLYLSGLALMHSRIDSKGYWRVVTRLWDRYLDGQSRAGDVIRQLIAVSDPGLVFHVGLTGRDRARTSWKVGLERRLRGQRERQPPTREEMGGWVEAFTGRLFDGLLHEPHHIFLAAYIAHRPEAADIPLPHWITSAADDPKRGG